MKKIEAVIKPFKLEEVKAALADVGVEGLTVTEVQGEGRQHGPAGGTGAGPADWLPKIKIEIIVTDEKFAGALPVIIAAARTSKIGDGNIFVLPVEQAVRIRTNETGSAAL